MKCNIQNMALESGSLSPIEAPSRLARNQHHSGKHVGYLPCVYTALPVISITAFTIISRLLLYSMKNLPLAIIIRLFYQQYQIKSCPQQEAMEGSCLNAIEAQFRLANKHDTVQHVSL